MFIRRTLITQCLTFISYAHQWPLNSNTLFCIQWMKNGSQSKQGPNLVLIAILINLLSNYLVVRMEILLSTREHFFLVLILSIQELKVYLLNQAKQKRCYLNLLYSDNLTLLIQKEGLHWNDQYKSQRKLSHKISSKTQTWMLDM